MTPEELEAMHGMKTGALIRASAVLGCLAACAPRDVILQADLYAAKIGLAFQIVDDILDVTETSEDWANPPAMLKITRPHISPCMAWKRPVKWCVDWCWRLT